jgi:hypothetical protein
LVGLFIFLSHIFLPLDRSAGPASDQGGKRDLFADDTNPERLLRPAAC